MRGTTVGVLFVADGDAPERFTDFFADDRVILPAVVSSTADAVTQVVESDIDCVVSGPLRTDSGPSVLAAVRDVRARVATVLFTTGPADELADGVADTVLRYVPDEPDLDRLRDAIRAVTGVAEIDRDGGAGWRFLGRFRWAETDSVGTTVVTAVAEALGRDGLDIAPLYDSVAPDALDRIVRGAVDREATADLVVRFVFDEYVVSVSAAGPVWYRPDKQ